MEVKAELLIELQSIKFFADKRSDYKRTKGARGTGSSRGNDNAPYLSSSYTENFGFQ